MARLYFKTREAARSSLKAHKLVDAGAEAPKGRRYARDISAHAAAAKEAKELMQGFMNIANEMYEEAA
jgi:hypothetical protein